MKTIKLDIRERLVGLGVFNNPENKVATSELKGYIDDASKFSISEEDRVAINWEDIKDEEGNLTGYRFDDKDQEPKEIELSDFTAKYLTDKLEAMEYSAADQLALSIISLLEKLKA